MRLVIVSNRLPISIKDYSALKQRNIGGLATGIHSYTDKISKGETDFDDYIWFGWPGGEVDLGEQPLLRQRYIDEGKYHPIFLDKELTDNYYTSYCNRVIWPLFHYCPMHIDYDNGAWNSYKEVNMKFFSVIRQHLRSNDVVWIHDYHLMILPRLIREEFCDARIAFFLHIPFPNVCMFRQLPRTERVDILMGLLGANLIGFHTDDYVKDFLNCASGSLGLNHESGSIIFDKRFVNVGAFPMGIDYDSLQILAESTDCLEQRDLIQSRIGNRKLILSVDRLDYTKGIINRLNAFYDLLSSHPQWQNKVVMMLVVAPSRREIESYQGIKRQIDELVGKINGTFSSADWLPIVYQYKQLDLKQLCALYSISDVALVTPLCDGMNLIAKEFVAANLSKNGMLVLSENVGASKELYKAVLVNPFSSKEITLGIVTALEMSESEKRFRNASMNFTLKQQNVVNWARDIVDATVASQKFDKSSNAGLQNRVQRTIVESYRASKRHLFLLDYDGTLNPLGSTPLKCRPSKRLLKLIGALAESNHNKIVIVSGRDKDSLRQWFAGIDVAFSADFGAWVIDGEEDRPMQDFDISWMKYLAPVMKRYASRLPFSQIETKTCAIVWDYRISETELKRGLVDDFVAELQSVSDQFPDMEVTRGQNALIIRSIGSGKGTAAAHWMRNCTYDFILAIGDDDADEELFRVVQPEGHTIRIGKGFSVAEHRLDSPVQVLDLLESLCDCEKRAQVILKSHVAI